MLSFGKDENELWGISFLLGLCQLGWISNKQILWKELFKSELKVLHFDKYHEALFKNSNFV